YPVRTSPDFKAHQYWDKFYEMHRDKFFKDRKWLFLEFPELLPLDANSRATTRRQGDRQVGIPSPGGSNMDSETSHHQHSGTTHCRPNADCQTAELSAKYIFYSQVGCGVGNSVFPIVNSINLANNTVNHTVLNIAYFIFLMKDHPDYDDSVCHAFVHDICEEMASFPFPPQSLDVILAVFVLSSIHPERMQRAVNRLSTCLKHGGIFLFRDYGRYDFSQLRFKKGRCLSENFYTRGDGTCVYFFTKEEVHEIFSSAGLEELQNLEDRRLQVNRGKKVVMHRVWMQSKYRKSYPPSPS
uniref:tRNA N(3)-cytidine methyltransferase n=1 Tax=Lates calcarifer TaxID=8187 RepID=A0A4W6FUU2_LATCA